MRKWLSTLLAVAFVATCGTSTILVSDVADAKPAVSKKAKKDSKDKKDKKPALSDILGRLSWGMDVDKAKSIIAENIMDDFAKKVEGNTDHSYVDNLRSTYNTRVENMQKSYQVLTRDNSASLSVSIVGEEFMPDANEAMLMSREDIATKYYFFNGGKLYKIAVVYDSSYLGPVAFDTFVATTAAKYGPAKDEVWDDDANFMEAIWKDGGPVMLTVKNKYTSYNTFLMVFVDEKVESVLRERHMEYFREMNSGPEVSSAIDALTADDSDMAGSSIDAMLGRTTKVDLLAGLSQDDIDTINGVKKEDEEEAKKKKKAKKEKKGKSEAKAKAGLEIF